MCLPTFGPRRRGSQRSGENSADNMCFFDAGEFAVEAAEGVPPEEEA
jgi:hypothetical protein